MGSIEFVSNLSVVTDQLYCACQRDGIRNNGQPLIQSLCKWSGSWKLSWICNRCCYQLIILKSSHQCGTSACSDVTKHLKGFIYIGVFQWKTQLRPSLDTCGLLRERQSKHACIPMVFVRLYHHTKGLGSMPGSDWHFTNHKSHLIHWPWPQYPTLEKFIIR